MAVQEGSVAQARMMLQRLSTRDSACRLNTLEQLCSCIASLHEDVLEQRSNSVEESDAYIDGCLATNCRDGVHENLLQPLTSVLRLAVQCPFKDVQEKCSSLLSEYREKGVKVPRQCGNGPSAFIPRSEFAAAQNGRDEKAKDLFIDVFLQSNRLDHLTTVMGLHPSYLEAFLRTQDFMLRGDGPLPFHYRHFIAIMATARHQCSYIVRLQENEFLAQGGDPDWLRGLTFIPDKLRRLAELIKLLVHQPWLITKEHLDDLLKGPSSWALSELVQAIVLTTHFSSLAGMVFGCGVNPEIDMEGGHTCRPPSLGDDPSSPSNNNYSDESEGASSNIEALMQKLRELEEQSEPDETQEEKLKKFEKVEKQNVELSPPCDDPCQDTSDLSHYLIEPDFKYKDFAKRGEVSQIPTFKAQDYSWEDQGFSLLNRYYPDVAPMLDDKFRLAYSLTYNTMGKKEQVDTSLLRRAIWNYIHSLFGIRHDDYDYGEVNSLMDRALKTYIKTVCCYPEKVTVSHYESFWRDFKHSEKVHVNLMVLEAKMQASLLYSLRAVMWLYTR
ncbi:sestrin-1-like isoform X1 [Patiria miniata]|uniref:Sestrin n=1 Tax=Patiria miniata TaxID=46514 RepID=A0A914A4R5_PATMI|nr:sestrin-1-like isoform X1 [Patiria miniata]